MTLRHMKILIGVCDNGSITKAAEKLYLAQPSVSCAIKELENHFGIKIFDRISRKLYLTKEGESLLNYARHITDLFAEAEQHMKNHDNTGILRLGSSITIGTCYLPGIVNTFSQFYPGIEVHVLISSSDIIERKLLRNELDLALIEGVAHSDYVVSEAFFHDHLVFVCSPSHPFSGRNDIAPLALKNEHFLLRETGSGTRELVASALLTFEFSVNPFWESTSTAALASAVEYDLGISVLPYELVKERILSGRVSLFHVEGIDLSRSFCILYHKNKYITPAMEKMIEIARDLSC